MTGASMTSGETSSATADTVRVSVSSSPSADWDAFVRQTSGFTAFHLSPWLTTLTQTLRHSVFALEARDDTNQLCGVLPLAQVRSPLFGNYLMSVPFASYGGPLGSPAACGALVEEATRIARDKRCALMELRGRVPLAVNLPVSNRKITVVLPLDGGPEAVFKRFESKLRSQVRRAEREGVSIRFGRELVADFYTVFAQHMRDLGTPALGRDFFESLANGYGDEMVVAVAYLADQPVACAIGFFWGEEFEITWASALIAFKKIAPNMSLYWRLMEHVAQRGARVFNFGRCTEGSNTHRFKRQWGGTDEPLFWYQWSASAQPASTPAPGGAFALAETIWRQLPVALTSRLGPHVARLLP